MEQLIESRDARETLEWVLREYREDNKYYFHQILLLLSSHIEIDELDDYDILRLLEGIPSLPQCVLEEFLNKVSSIGIFFSMEFSVAHLETLAGLGYLVFDEDVEATSFTLRMFSGYSITEGPVIDVLLLEMVEVNEDEEWNIVERVVEDEVVMAKLGFLKPLSPPPSPGFLLKVVRGETVEKLLEMYEKVKEN